MLSYITWNVDPDVFVIFGREIKWYAILFALSFYLGYILIDQILRKKNMSQKHISKLTIYLIVGCVAGLRLGHCFFYEPGYYLSHPLEILMIWKGGLASHGAAIGIPIALYLYVRKVKKNYFWLLDRIVIVILLIAPFVRTGNLMNSEIIGDKTNQSHAFLFVNEIDRELSYRNSDFVEKTEITQLEKDTIVDNTTYREIELKIYFKKNKFDITKLDSYLKNQFYKRLSEDEDLIYNTKLFDVNTPVKVSNEKDYNVASLNMYAIPRHPSQIYEALAYFLFFIMFILYYIKRKGMIKQGFLFGMFLICVFGFRFGIEFLKEVQVEFESSMSLDMGQWLSIPFILLGIYMILRSRKMPAE